MRVPGNGKPDRDAFARAVRAKGVQCSVPVKTPVHRMPGFRRDVCLPETERAADETLALPIGGEMSRRELQRLVSTCNALGGLLQAKPSSPSDARGNSGARGPIGSAPGGSKELPVRGMIYLVAARETSVR